MRIIMTGGGTGGHIYPAIAIADEFKRRDPNAEILFVGAEIGMEKDIVPSRGYRIELIEADGFSRSLRGNILTATRVMRGSMQARRILKKFRPDFVVGTGGYASAPVVIQAQNMGIPTFIHEQNAIPGRTNKFLERRVNNVFLGFAKAGESFRYKDKQVIAGNPVRSEFMSMKKDEARAKLGFKPDDFVVLSFGGSQGAGRINKAMIDTIQQMHDDPDMVFCMGTGSYYYEAICRDVQERGFAGSDRVRIMEYIDDMASYLSAADLVISRSGALTVAEVTICGAPTIFIPFPQAADNHQYYNAMAVAQEGGAVVIEEKDLEEGTLTEEIQKLRRDPVILADMSEKSRKCGPVKAAQIICDTIIEACR